MFTKTGIKSTNHDGAEISVRVDKEWREIGILAGEKVAIYFPLRRADEIVKAILAARDAGSCNCSSIEHKGGHLTSCPVAIRAAADCAGDQRP
jgi:hypothetical protein